MADAASTPYAVLELIFLIDKLSISSESKSTTRPKRPIASRTRPAGSRCGSRGADASAKVSVEGFIVPFDKLKISTISETKIKPAELVSRRQRPSACIHDLPTEILELIFQYLEGDQRTLKALRHACKGFSELANPLVFKTLSFETLSFYYRFPSCWQNLELPTAKYVRSLKIESTFLTSNELSFIQLNSEILKIEHLKISNYQCLFIRKFQIPIATNFLTKLHIDLRWRWLHKKVIGPEYHSWQYLGGPDHFANLQNLIISQDPVCDFFKYEYFDILYLWSRISFPRLRNLELYFLSTTPDHLVDLLESCNHELFRRIRIYRPVWRPEELNHSRLQETILALEKDDKVTLEDCESWVPDGQYSEEELSFMIENDILPMQWDHVPVNGWESDVLNRYVEYRRVVLKQNVRVTGPDRRYHKKKRMEPPSWIPRKGLDYTFIEDL
ncbi:MAG: hypothetical protein Q9202_002717 [Teloschistes flavicans]